MPSRRWLKRIVMMTVGGAVGAAAGYWLGWPDLEVTKALLTKLPGIGPILVVVFPFIPAAVISGLAAPLTGASLGFFLTLLLDWLVPDPPSFLDRDLKRLIAQDKIFDPLLRAAFQGRDGELGVLNDLTGPPDAAFRWIAITGPSGIGKTRLAAEWLRGQKGVACRGADARCDHPQGLEATPPDPDPDRRGRTFRGKAWPGPESFAPGRHAGPSDPGSGG